jgi:hypothetical protein
MGRASIPTLLSIDRWAELLGVSPIIWNQMFSVNFGPTADCGDPWYQYAWQNPEFTSREDIARAINEAEGMITSAMGYFPMPDWTMQERKQTTRPAKPELIARSNTNVRGYHKSIELDHGYVIAGGRRKVDLIEAGVAITLTDEDGAGGGGDGYAEVATSAGITTSVVDCEIHAYLPGRAGSFAYEIRPIVVTSAAGVVTITFNSWQLVDPDLQDMLSAERPENRIDAEAAASYLDEIDVYRVWNDPQSQVTLMWEQPPVGCNQCGGSGCAACSFSTQTGCLFVRDERLGFMGYRPATWDADDEEFDTADLVICRDPEQLRLWYYSGWESTDPRVTCPRTQMDPQFEMAIVHLSVTLLDRNVCSCNNVERFVKHWSEDLSRLGREVSHQVTPQDLSNPFGPTRGAIAAWKAINMNGRRIRR